MLIYALTLTQSEKRDGFSASPFQTQDLEFLSVKVLHTDENRSRAGIFAT
jgi:hypothetical protein